VLDAAEARIATERSARKEPFGEREVRALLARVATVVIARGTKIATRPAGEVAPADLVGPTGNYRAPMIVKGRTLLVGFNREALLKLV
jgi:hypothetical protein